MRALLFTRKTLAFFCLCCLLPLRPAKAQTQSQTLLTINPNVGEVIDQEEKIRFNLFPFFDNAQYQIGRFFQLPDKQIVLEVIMKNGQTESRKYTQGEFDLTGQLIDAKAANTQAPKPAQPVQPVPQKQIAISPSTGYQNYIQPLTGKIYYVILSDGMKFFANIVEKRQQEYVFATQYYGNITTAFAEIRYLKEVENRLRRDAFWIPNPHDSRLFFGPTGRGIPRGEGYFQTIWGYLNSFNYGVSDNFSLGTTFFLFPGVPLEYSIFSLTPKLSLPVAKKTSVAAGILYATFFGENFGIVYGAGTYGDKNDHITAGLGFGFLNDEMGKTPVYMFGGVKRISNRVSLMTENYVVAVSPDEMDPQQNKTTYSGGLYGLRFIWPRTNLDLASFYFYDPTNTFDPFFTTYIFPAYVSFTFKLGNRRQIGRIY